jgi:hypothetical protein
MVLDDPVAHLQMPPDVEIENTELQDQGTGRHGGQQPGQD